MTKQHFLDLDKFLSKIGNCKFQINQKKIYGKFQVKLNAKFSGENSEKTKS